MSRGEWGGWRGGRCRVGLLEASVEALERFEGRPNGRHGIFNQRIESSTGLDASFHTTES